MTALEQLARSSLAHRDLRDAVCALAVGVGHACVGASWILVFAEQARRARRSAINALWARLTWFLLAVAVPLGVSAFGWWFESDWAGWDALRACAIPWPWGAAAAVLAAVFLGLSCCLRAPSREGLRAFARTCATAGLSGAMLWVALAQAAMLSPAAGPVRRLALAQITTCPAAVFIAWRAAQSVCLGCVLLAWWAPRSARRSGVLSLGTFSAVAWLATLGVGWAAQHQGLLATEVWGLTAACRQGPARLAYAAAVGLAGLAVALAAHAWQSGWLRMPWIALCALLALVPGELARARLSDPWSVVGAAYANGVQRFESVVMRRSVFTLGGAGDVFAGQCASCHTVTSARRSAELLPNGIGPFLSALRDADQPGNPYRCMMPPLAASDAQAYQLKDWLEGGPREAPQRVRDRRAYFILVGFLLGAGFAVVRVIRNRRRRSGLKNPRK